ncbi:hypothetical protein EVAR_101295_1 [Eumeta japonica]|uniref:Uncharacterized protein n=1 Tax=Eumeta variegata TaxID=151549 RepID=A0A4C1SPW9_EUMVA|nr:hypothetical protein EVAR_101295_1 [Eumeta japonica]
MVIVQLEQDLSNMYDNHSIEIAAKMDEFQERDSDANNLYGWAMSESLPEGKFEWIEDIDSFDISTVSENSDFGYILEVDLDYPEELHDSHNDLPFCAELKSPPIQHYLSPDDMSSGVPPILLVQKKGICGRCLPDASEFWRGLFSGTERQNSVVNYIGKGS